MTHEPAQHRTIPTEETGSHERRGEPRVIGLDEYCRLVLARRSIDRVHRGLPVGYRGLKDPRTGQTWLIREEALRGAC